MEIINITCLRQKSQRHRPKWVGKLPERLAGEMAAEVLPLGGNSRGLLVFANRPGWLFFASMAGKSQRAAGTGSKAGGKNRPFSHGGRPAPRYFALCHRTKTLCHIRSGRGSHRTGSHGQTAGRSIFCGGRRRRMGNGSGAGGFYPAG